MGQIALALSSQFNSKLFKHLLPFLELSNLYLFSTPLISGRFAETCIAGAFPKLVRVAVV